MQGAHYTKIFGFIYLCFGELFISYTYFVNKITGWSCFGVKIMIAMKRLMLMAALPLALSGCAPGMMNPNPGEITVDRAYYTGKYERSASILIPAAARGEPWAEMRMGRSHFEGRGVEEDIPKALYWFKKVSAHHGDDAWSQGDMLSIGEMGLFNQNSDALSGQFYAAQIVSTEKWGLVDMQQAFLYANNVLKETGGTAVYLCCIEIFENGLVIPGAEQKKLLNRIKAAMTPEELARAEALSATWSPYAR